MCPLPNANSRLKRGKHWILSLPLISFGTESLSFDTLPFRPTASFSPSVTTPPKTSAASKMTSSGLWPRQRAQWTLLALLDFTNNFWKALASGSISRPVQFRRRSKKRLLLRYSPSKAPASTKKPLRLPLKRISGRVRCQHGTYIHI